jgi:HSP20 family protein
MAHALIHLMHSLFLPAADTFRETHWRPAADVYRTRSGWLVKFDLAGVRPEDIELRARGNALTVSGRRRDCTLEEGCRYHRLEIAYSRFERTVELPFDLDALPINTEYRDGMLLVHIQTETHP